MAGRKEMKNTQKAWVLLSAGAFVAAQVASAAPQPGVFADTFSADTDGIGDVTFGQNSVTVSFDKRISNAYSGTPDPDAIPMKVLTAVSTDEGVFAGNYDSAGVEGVAFALSNSVPGKPKIMVSIKCLDPWGRTFIWSNRTLELGDENSGECVNNLALDLSEGWFPNDTRARFERDLQNVVSVGFTIQQDQLDAQSVEVSNLRLLLANQVITPSATLHARLANYFGVASIDDITDLQKAQDSDKDGLSDYTELMESESDPNDANSALLVSAERIHNGGLRLSWPGVVGRTYTVFRTDTPTGDFEPVPGKVGIYCEETGEMDVTLANDRGKYFYSVQQVR
jgi:hypothetical protein